MSAAKFQRREYEKVALKTARMIRMLFLFWTRRGRKSTNLGNMVFDDISSAPGRMAVAASASLLLGKELVTVTLSAAERTLVVGTEAAAVQQVFSSGAEGKGLQLQTADIDSGKIVTGLTPQDFAEMYSASRLELRLYFDRTAYSRLQVIAPNPATARGWRALVIRDEVGYTSPNFETDMQIATDAMMRDTPDLKMIYASNLPSDDRHPAFTMTLPRDLTAPTEEEQFPADPRGHLYIGQTGMMIHRVALKDAYAAGHRLFDDQGHPMTYDQAHAFPPVRMGWDISYALNHKAGGSAAVDVIQFIMAQRRGADLGCYFCFVESHAEFLAALAVLRARIGSGKVGIGVDVASSNNDTSNPTCVTVMEDTGGSYPIRVMLCWKERTEAVQRDRITAVVDAVASRPAGGSARALAIDGSNERLFADAMRVHLAGKVPVYVIVSGEKMDPCPPAYAQTGVNYKTYLGDQYAEAINSGRVPMPPDTYVKEDHQLVTKSGGRYECTAQPDGKHGDTFDGGKLSLHALMGANNSSLFEPVHFANSAAARVIASRRDRTVGA